MAKPRRKGKPNDLRGMVHDRRATESNRGVKNYLVPEEVDDPFEPGEKITVMRSLRNDPLGNLHARKSIDAAQYEAGRRFQRDFETAERGPKAIDFTKEAVDGGLMPEPLTEEQRKAGKHLARVYRDLGADGAALVHDVLIEGLTYAQIAAKRSYSGERWEKYFGMRFGECLHTLAKTYGFATEGTGKQRVTNV